MAKNNGKISPKLRGYIDSPNLAESLSDQELIEIGADAVKGAKEDDDSRHEWKKRYKDALKIAKQVKDGKNTPWPGAAEVKYPIILDACIQYNARTNPEIVKGDKVVNVTIAQDNPSQKAEDRAERLSAHMSYQLLVESDNWRSDTDKLLMALPLVGVVYRKSYFCPIDKKPVVILCLPEDIIVHNDIASLKTAERLTHVLHLDSNDILERQRAGLYSEIPLEDLEENSYKEDTANVKNETQPASAEPMDDQHTVYEQHTFLDLDDDGYKEPYIVTVHKETQKILRIVARYDEDSFVFNENNGKMIKINALQYFTDYHFIPSPDGTFHSLGFGEILYPLNETVNTIINQLLDAGTLANRGGGWISKSLRARKEDVRFKMGEFKQINVPTGTTLAQSIYPMPAKEASPTLFNLLGLITNAAKELSSVSDVMQGQMPAPNTPATTVMTIVEQGMKVFSATLYRLYASFKREFQKLYDINQKYLSLYDNFSLATKSGEVSLEDYQDKTFLVAPVADPSMATDAHRLAKAQALMGLLQFEEVSKTEVLKRYLEALKVSDIDELMPPPDPKAPPSPQQQLLEAELAIKKQQPGLEITDRHLKAQELEIEDKKVVGEIAYKGTQAAAAKIASVAELATADRLDSAQTVEMATQQAQTIAQQPTAAPEAAPDAITQSIEDLVGLQSQQPGLQSGPQSTPPPGAIAAPGAAPGGAPVEEPTQEATQSIPEGSSPGAQEQEPTES